METRKIIGYKYPYETVNGNKVIDQHIRKYRYGYYVSFTENAFEIDHHIAKEIAESFEPIYEEVVFGSFEDIIKYFKGDMVTIATKIVIFNNDYVERNILINKLNYSFTPEFEEKLKELGIEI